MPEIQPSGAVRPGCGTTVGRAGSLSVADQGVGIAPDDLPYVFAPGYRARNTAGVAAVRAIVHALGGSV